MVASCIRHFEPGCPLGRLASLLGRADLVIVNLECAITERLAHRSGAPKAFYFGAPPAGLAQAQWIVRWMGALCCDLGTRPDNADGAWTLAPA